MQNKTNKSNFILMNMIQIKQWFILIEIGFFILSMDLVIYSVLLFGTLNAVETRLEMLIHWPPLPKC